MNILESVICTPAYTSQASMYLINKFDFIAKNFNARWTRNINVTLPLLIYYTKVCKILWPYYVTGQIQLQLNNSYEMYHMN